MKDCLYNVAELLPHAPPMVLVDEVLSYEESAVSAVVDINNESLFYVEGLGVPSYVGLEYMAQTCGLYAGLLAKERGAEPKLGFLLGTRNFHVASPWFLLNERLIVTAKEILSQDMMGVFDCRIYSGDIEIASAQLNLYQPEDTASLSHNV